MLHLAQVQRNESSGNVELRLLAQQESQYSWAIMNSADTIPATNFDALNEGVLVLVELCHDYKVLNIREAKDWVLELVQQYLTNGITPAFLEQEAERAEQWRQDLTLQSQELARKTLELEARREQIQRLEEDLKREK